MAIDYKQAAEQFTQYKDSKELKKFLDGFTNPKVRNEILIQALEKTLSPVGAENIEELWHKNVFNINLKTDLLFCLRNLKANSLSKENIKILLAYNNAEIFNILLENPELVNTIKAIAISEAAPKVLLKAALLSQKQEFIDYLFEHNNNIKTLSELIETCQPDQEIKWLLIKYLSQPEKINTKILTAILSIKNKYFLLDIISEQGTKKNLITYLSKLKTEQLTDGNIKTLLEYGDTTIIRTLLKNKNLTEKLKNIINTESSLTEQTRIFLIGLISNDTIKLADELKGNTFKAILANLASEGNSFIATNILNCLMQSEDQTSIVGPIMVEGVGIGMQNPSCKLYSWGYAENSFASLDDSTYEDSQDKKIYVTDMERATNIYIGTTKFEYGKLTDGTIIDLENPPEKLSANGKKIYSAIWQLPINTPLKIFLLKELQQSSADAAYRFIENIKTNALHGYTLNSNGHEVIRISPNATGDSLNLYGKGVILGSSHTGKAESLRKISAKEIPYASSEVYYIVSQPTESSSVLLSLDRSKLDIKDIRTLPEIKNLQFDFARIPLITLKFGNIPFQIYLSQYRDTQSAFLLMQLNQLLAEDRKMNQNLYQILINNLKDDHSFNTKLDQIQSHYQTLLDTFQQQFTEQSIATTARSICESIQETLMMQLECLKNKRASLAIAMQEKVEKPKSKRLKKILYTAWNMVDQMLYDNPALLIDRYNTDETFKKFVRDYVNSFTDYDRTQRNPQDLLIIYKQFFTHAPTLDQEDFKSELLNKIISILEDDFKELLSLKDLLVLNTEDLATVIKQINITKLWENADQDTKEKFIDKYQPQPHETTASIKKPRSTFTKSSLPKNPSTDQLLDILDNHFTTKTAVHLIVANKGWYAGRRNYWQSLKTHNSIVKIASLTTKKQLILENALRRNTKLLTFIKNSLLKDTWNINDALTIASSKFMRKLAGFTNQASMIDHLTFLQKDKAPLLPQRKQVRERSRSRPSTPRTLTPLRTR